MIDSSVWDGSVLIGVVTQRRVEPPGLPIRNPVFEASQLTRYTTNNQYLLFLGPPSDKWSVGVAVGGA